MGHTVEKSAAFPLSDVMQVIPRSMAADVRNFGRFIFIVTTALPATELSPLSQRFLFSIRYQCWSVFYSKTSICRCFSLISPWRL